MNRRQLAILMGAVATAGWASRTVKAQDVPVEVQDFVRLDKPVEVALPAGKRIEVVEFFWYECPHCNAFEPLLESWVRRLPADVAFRNVAVGFTPRHEPAQRMFYALQSMGLVEALHAKVYQEIHERFRRIDFEGQMASMVSSLGGDGAKFREVVRSPEVAALVRRANQLTDAFDVDGVPALGIHGRYVTAPAMAGSRERALKVADYLIQRVRESA